MADTSLFSRLRRLFSSDVIIRNVGGKQLKVMDTGRIQKYGNLASNSLYDRFTRLHRPVGSSLQYNPTLNYQSMRLQLYSDYEAMDHDPIIAAALDIISDETTIRNQYGDVLNINSQDENVRRVLHNLFYDVLNIEFNLATWVRNMCKYGDFYLKLEVSEKYGVYNVLPLSTYELSTDILLCYVYDSYFLKFYWNHFELVNEEMALIFLHSYNSQLSHSSYL